MAFGGTRRALGDSPASWSRGLATAFRSDCPLDSPSARRDEAVGAFAPLRPAHLADQTVAGWNSSVLPSGSLHRSCTRPPGCVLSTYLIPSRSSVAFIAS